MVLPLSFNPARSLARHQLSCSRSADRSRSHYFASSSRASGAGESIKSTRKKAQGRGGPAGSSLGGALGGLTIQPLQKASTTTGRPLSSGIVCTVEDCNFKADERTVIWLRELFDGIDVDRCPCLSLPVRSPLQKVTLLMLCACTGMVQSQRVI